MVRSSRIAATFLVRPLVMRCRDRRPNETTKLSGSGIQVSPRPRTRGGNASPPLRNRREGGEKIETETRFYLASAVLTAIAAAAFARGHWGIENALHWVLDMAMRNDESRARTGNAAANPAIIKHIAYKLIRRGKGEHFLPKQAKARRMGRRLPPKPPRRMIPSPDSPAGWRQGYRIWTNSAARNRSSPPARWILPRIETFVPVCAPPIERDAAEKGEVKRALSRRERSSPKATSRTQWSRFSIVQSARISPVPAGDADLA